MRVRERTGKILRRLAPGFSMTELILALAVSVIAAAGIYSVYTTQIKQSGSQRIYNDLQNNLRYAMDYMKNELYLAGFRAVDADQPITQATAGAITFEYWDDNSSAASPYDGHVRVTYTLAGTELQRTFLQYNTSTTAPNPRYDPSTSVTQTLAKNVEGLTFSYRKSDDQAYAIGTDDIKDIRTIRIILAGKSGKRDPTLKDPVSGGDYYRKLTLTGEVKSRNLAIASNPFDDNAPGIPGGLNAWDPQQCGRLNLEWDALIENDLAGYTIFYGLSPGNYLGRRRVNRGPGTIGVKETFTLTGLQSYNAMYYVAISSYDRSNNSVGISSEVYGNPDPDGTTAAGGPDSTVNPGIPLPPTELAAAYPVDGQVQLNWTPSATAGVVGYRLFRAEQSDFSDEVMVANELELPAASTGYLDGAPPSAPLVGCSAYYYRIAAIHCDAAEFDDGNYADTDYALVDATPTDSLPPTTPTLIARPGYRRIILNLENPTLGAEPDFAYTTIYWSTAAYPVSDENGYSTSPSIPDYGGNITDDGTVPPINFDSETQVAPSEPELQSDTKYFFLAVAFDRCGNHSATTSDSLAEGEQCGDCDATEICYEGPPAPTGMATSGCSTSVELNWEDIDQIDYRDLAGFRVLRREGYDWSLNPGTEVELTGGDATWFSHWTDTTTGTNPLEMGKRYSYKICSTDCYHEQHNGKTSADWPDPGNDPDDNINCTILNDIYPGAFYANDTTDIPRTGNLLALPPNFRHNTVTFLFDNLAAGSMTQEMVNLTWSDIDIFLKAISIGDDSTTSREVVAFLTPPSPSGQNVTYSPTKAVDGLDQDVPFRMTFTKGDSGVDNTVDMRQEVIFVNELAFTNTSTLDSTCNQTDKIRVPLGPVTTGVVQNFPDNPTLAWAVPGDSGVNPMNRVIVPGGVEVTVRAVVLDTIFQGLYDVRLWYYVDSGAVLSSAPSPSIFSLSNSIAMVQEAGNLYVTENPIPASDDSNVWYYILAVDNTGNFDREPEVDSGVFQYYQQQADVCGNIPESPTDLAGTTTSSSVTLSWTPPALNTDGSTFSDPLGYNIYRNDGVNGWELFDRVVDPDVTYVDSFTGTEIVDNNYSYYVTAVDDCQPDANESDPSSTFTECEGAPDCIFNVFTSGGEPMAPGDSFTVDLTVCAKQNGTAGETVYMQACTEVGGPITSGPDADPIPLVEVDDTGLFQIGGRGEVITFLNAEYTGADLDLLVGETDVITVGAWSDTAYSDATCDTTFSCTVETINVETPPPDPCVGRTAPDAPTSLTFTTDDCNGYNANLSWIAPASGADYYKIYECTGSDTCVPTNYIGRTGDSAPAFTRNTFSVAKLKSHTFRWRVTALDTVGDRCSPLESGFSDLEVEDDICP